MLRGKYLYTKFSQANSNRVQDEFQLNCTPFIKLPELFNAEKVTNNLMDGDI